MPVPTKSASITGPHTKLFIAAFTRVITLSIAACSFITKIKEGCGKNCNPLNIFNRKKPNHKDSVVSVLLPESLRNSSISVCTFGPRSARASPEYHPSTVVSFRRIHLVIINCCFVAGNYICLKIKNQVRSDKTLFLLT